MNEGYRNYLASPRWNTLRSAMLHPERRCEACNSADALDIHHRDTRHLACERVEDIIVLCDRCFGLFGYGVPA